jgi:putative transposase
MILAHKIALGPAPEQAVYFARAAGTARFAWNWALGRWQEEYQFCTDRHSTPRTRSSRFPADYRYRHT